VDLASEGRGILLISSELIELVEPWDRIPILREGRLVGEMPGPGNDADALFEACIEGGGT